AFTYQQAGNTLKVYSGATLLLTAPLQGDSDGTQIVTTNGSVSAILTGTVMTLGGATVSSTQGAVTPTVMNTTVTTGATVATAASMLASGHAFRAASEAGVFNDHDQDFHDLAFATLTLLGMSDDTGALL
ncbi:MAG: hypothetical protein WCP34_17115, partial [Pseudomonadota bacterium]